MFHQQSGDRPMTLPKTIEAATQRYLYHYHNNFSGSASEMLRLKDMTQAFIYRLRKVAPRFYEEKLPTFINQACSTLLLCDTNDAKGARDFHMTHGIFMSILHEFRRSQPSGDVDFANEKKRFETKKDLVTKQLQLLKRIDELDAVEFSADDLGDDDDPNCSYSKIMAEKEVLERELNAVSLEIAVLEGLDLEKPVHFELRVPPRSILNKLTKDELKILEKQMFDFYNAHKDRTALYVDISLIEGMFQKLHIEPDRFQKVQIATMQKDALDAYRAYFRRIDRDERNQYFETLIHSKHLLPKEGAILDPNDLPAEVREKLETNDQQGQRQIEEILETFGARTCNEKEIGDELQDSGDEEADEKAQVYERLRRKGIKYERVKEEPRDDFKMDEFSLDEEHVVDLETAEALADNNMLVLAGSQADEDEPEGKKPRKLIKRADEGSDGLNNSDERSNSNEDNNEDDDDDDDIECLGTVEPLDKIKLYQLSEE